MMYQFEVIADDVYGEEFHRLSPATPGAGAIDLRVTEDVTLYPDHLRTIDTGLAIHISNKLIAGLVLPRSGLSSQRITMTNTIGLIDSDYQGKIFVNLYNANHTPHNFRRGDRIAQLLLVHIVPPKLTQYRSVEKFENRTLRGEGGFGSTGFE